jgi:hypothetical protein
MIDNFKQMTMLLKLLTLSAIAPLLFAANSMFPNTVLVVFGKSIASSTWWASGAGSVALFVAILTSCSAVLMLRRARYARLTYIFALVATTVSVPFVAHVTETHESTFVSTSLAVDCVLTALIAIYLYSSRSVQAYFAPRNS